MRALYDDLVNEGIDGVEIEGVDGAITEKIKILEETLGGKHAEQIEKISFKG